MARLIFDVAAVAAGLVSTVSAATAGDFNVLTMNVAGLPAIFNGNDVPGDKATNAGTIGTLFNLYDYDMIHVQEDFNYHAYLYATDKHPERTPTSGGAAIGTGENSLSNFKWYDFARTKWATCSDASGADCLTPKGFSFMRTIIDDGIYIDFYNLHSDAGTEPTDLTARAANLKQLADYIDKWSTGNSVVIMGDTNSRYSRANVGDIPNVFHDQNGMTDSWLQFYRNGIPDPVETLCDNPSLINTCETVDKIFYRGSKQLSLQATYWNYESSKFKQPNGDILSDHNPITVNFTWTASPSYRQSALFGGNSDNWFNDLTVLPAKPKASVITFRGKERLDAVSLTLTNGQVLSHGGTGGTAATLTLAATESWISAKLCKAAYKSNTRNFYIQATTSTGRTLAVGTTTSDCATFTAPAGWAITGFMGHDGDEMDEIAFIYSPI